MSDINELRGFIAANVRQTNNMIRYYSRELHAMYYFEATYADIVAELDWPIYLIDFDCFPREHGKTTLYTEQHGLAAKLMEALNVRRATVDNSKMFTNYHVTPHLTVAVKRSHRGPDCHRAVVMKIEEWCGETPDGMYPVKELADDEEWTHEE